MIKVDRLCKSYDDFHAGKFVAVDQVSFECFPGEIFGLLGPNGAGKSTTMRMLSTVLEPTSGTAVVAGFDVRKKPTEVRHRIGFMSANTALYDRMTAREYIEYFGKLYGMDDDQLASRIETIFDSLQMNSMRGKLISKMSTGMKQKVSIARAIIHDPPVLIFDEPTTGLDIIVSRAVLDSIQELRDQGKCILYSTHIMREVEKICDRVGIISRGRMMEMGTIEDLTIRYDSNDVEDIFFKVIRQNEAEQAVPA